ncbi:MAG TPA: glycosyltransferase family 1 protein [Ferruginibacter sp.]|nr:glycosyltransferase family 1 protein [Ferruginibacter sp.]HMP21379.1 glycosyltransferase family 1 protein [Ferruginibacter sp.]
MKIGFDGKRFFQNRTGLGNYARSLLTILQEYHPENEYHLFTPKTSNLFQTANSANTHIITPLSLLYKKSGALWRRIGMIKDIQKSGVEIFHGVSNELPAGIGKTNIKSVVTIHDLIFERYPETYHFDERYVHRWKVKQACREADIVIAISQQTKNDLIEYYKIPAAKIVVCYQSCHPLFEQKVSESIKQAIKKKYNLPDQYFLFVSSITARKNLVSICRALIALKGKLDIPLVIIGNGKKQKLEVQQLAKEQGVAHLLIFLNDMEVSKQASFTTAADFPAIYQQALALIYPSIFEGFGLPVLEALVSGIPVISSNTSSLLEVGGDAALYFDPYDTEMLAKHLQLLAADAALRQQLIQKGHIHAALFSRKNYAANMMEIYTGLLQEN